MFSKLNKVIKLTPSLPYKYKIFTFWPILTGSLNVILAPLIVYEFLRCNTPSMNTNTFLSSSIGIVLSLTEERKINGPRKASSIYCSSIDSLSYAPMLYAKNFWLFSLKISSSIFSENFLGGSTKTIWFGVTVLLI